MRYGSPNESALAPRAYRELYDEVLAETRG